MSQHQTPRAHAELASRYMADDSLKCWLWNGDEWELAASPMWYAESIYHVGHETPTAPPKRKVTMAGITFDAPESVKPRPHTKYWAPIMLSAPIKTFSKPWRDSEFDRKALESGLVHLKEEDAELHAEALRELNRQMCGMEDVQ